MRRDNPELSEPDALTAMDLGARRLDLIGLKFQLAQEIPAAYAQAVAQQHDKTQSSATNTLLSEISGANGRCQDLRDAYLGRERASTARCGWLRIALTGSTTSPSATTWRSNGGSNAAASSRRRFTAGKTGRTCPRPLPWDCRSRRERALREAAEFDCADSHRHANPL